MVAPSILEGMSWWQYVLIIYFVVFAALFLRVSVLVNRKRTELRATRGIVSDELGHPLTYLHFLPDILRNVAFWPLDVAWGGLRGFFRGLM